LRRLIGENIGENIALSILPAPSLALIKADRGQVEQIILNLVVNAREAMPEGGQLTLSTAMVRLEEGDLTAMPEARPGTFVCLSVTDTGVGMDQEILDHLFEPFFTTKGFGKGTGLGLATVYGIAKQHEGWVHVYSKPGAGTTFEVCLPALPGTGEPEPALPPPAAPAARAGQGGRILLVEDEEGVRAVALRVLREHGYQVHVAASAQEGRRVFDQVGGEVDLLFSDVVLPDRNGLDLADELLAIKPGLPVLLCSGYTDQRSRWPAIRQRGIRFLQKPYPNVELLRAVRELLQGRTPA